MERRHALKSIALGGAAFLGMREPAVEAMEQKPVDAERKRVARFAHFTDTHVYGKRRAPQGLATAIQHVHALDDRPDFILNGGDAIYDALEVSREEAESQWSIWKTTWKEHGSLPLRHCLGNHDVWGWNKAKSRTTESVAGWGKQLSLDYLGLERPYYEFDAGNWKLIVLDSMTFDEQTAYRAELDKTQFDWLVEQLKSTPATTHIAIVSHIPILTVGTIGFTEELRKHPEANKLLSHVDAYEILNLLQSHANVKLCLSGHTHLTESVSFGGIDFINSGAVCGLWWKGKFRHTSEGYNIVELFDDGSHASRYETYGWHVG